MDFSKFDDLIDTEQLRKDVDEAVKNDNNDFSEVPDGYYIVNLEKLELGETKDGRPMVKWEFIIVEPVNNPSEYDLKGNNKEALFFFKNYKPKKKPHLFMNRVIYGTKNDSNMIASVEGWIAKLDIPDFDYRFRNYRDFSNVLMDIEEEMDGIEILIDYKKDNFNSISVVEVFE